MNKQDNNTHITTSILDRLLVETSAARHNDDLDELKRSVRRDLNWLLNTRQLADRLPAGLEAANRSLLTYGLPDFGQYSASNSADREDVRRALEEAISRFEPRLENVRVVLREAEDGKDAKQKALVSLSVDFVVMALLQVKPTPQPIVFDTVLDLRSGKYEVKEP